MIRYIKNEAIDRNRWDDCIETAANGLPYALSWWLDRVNPGWKALILDDYQAVMPLTGRNRYGLPFLAQPYLTQQLGIFSSSLPSGPLVKEFLDAIPVSYRYVHIHLNRDNPAQHPAYTVEWRKNYVIDLNFDFISLESRYHRNCRRNVQKAIQKGLQIKPGVNPSAFVHFVHRHLDHALKNVPRNFYTMLREMIQYTLQHKTGKILSVHNRLGETVASAWIVTVMNRCLFLVCASTPTGHENQAMYLLVDHLIRELAGRPLLFDFTGSNLPGVAYFDAGFGAQETLYPALHRNALPWWVKWAKR